MFLGWEKVRGNVSPAINEIKDHKCCWWSGLKWSQANWVSFGFNAPVIILGSKKMELAHTEKKKKKRRKLVSGMNRKSLEMCDKQRLVCRRCDNLSRALCRLGWPWPFCPTAGHPETQTFPGEPQHQSCWKNPRFWELQGMLPINCSITCTWHHSSNCFSNNSS